MSHEAYMYMYFREWRQKIIQKREQKEKAKIKPIHKKKTKTHKQDKKDA